MTARSGRVLGLDLGQARIGVAISDPDGRVAVPVGTVRTGAPQDVQAARENGLRAIAVRTGITPPEDLVAAHPDMLLDDLTQLDLSCL